MSDPVRAVVGVVGEDADPAVAAVEDAGGTPATGDVDAVLSADPDALIAVGERAVLTLAARPDPPAVPILPVAAGPGLRSVPRSAVSAGTRALVAGDGRLTAYPVLSVRVDGDVCAHALQDVTLLTAEPARISEYAVATGDTTVAQFRADGVVVATPAGSHGYARRLDAPVVAADTGVALVTPIAPFATDADHWVLDLDSLALEVARDEVPVELLADDRRIGPVDAGVTVDVAPTATATLLTVPQSRPQFSDRA